MEHAICLDGVNLVLDVDDIDVDLSIPGLQETTCEQAGPWERCEGGEAMEPVIRYADGTTIYFHCAPEGSADARGYRVESSHPHHWNVQIEERPGTAAPQKVAKLKIALD